jgi:aryl-alcohol dehydrogenase-like predicted oxidoreductase
LPRTITIAGVDVARIGLGTNRLTPEKSDFVREAVDAGIQLIDTAHGYTGGQSERAIGEAGLDGNRALIATKGGYDKGSGAPEALRAQIEESFARLRREVIDLYYLHRVHPETPLADSLAAINEYREQGRIKEVGISAVSVEQIEQAREVVPIAAVQNHYNLDERGHDDVLDHCEREGIVFVPYYPLRGEGPAALDEIARNHGATRHQIALAWLLRRSPVTLPIPGTVSLEHARENLAALEIELSDEEFDALG